MTHAMLLTRLYNLPGERRRLVIRASAALAVATVAVAILPFRRAIELGSIPVGDRTDFTPEEYVWAVEAAARRLPWHSVCIQKGIAIQRLLRGSGIDAILHYGARREQTSGQLEAHVWVTVASQVVAGGEEAPGFAEVATFP